VAFVDHHSLPDRTRGRLLDATIRVGGEIRRIEGSGSGPIDAYVDALCRTLGLGLEVVDYHEHALGQGADAAAIAYVEMRRDGGRPLFGVGRDKNIVTASLKAVTKAANRLMAG
jgi:2-isopropylmalate synthase